MKKKLRSSIFAFLAITFVNTGMIAQTNFDFETWASNGTNPESATGWSDLNSLTPTYIPDTSVVKKSGQSGFAAELHPIDLSIFGYNFVGSFIQYGVSGSNGINYTSLHDSLQFYYKYTPGSNTAGQFGVALTLFNSSTLKADTIAVANFTTSTSASSFTKVKIPFTYFSTATPDSLRALGILVCGSNSTADKAARFTIDQVTLIGNHTVSTGIKTVYKTNTVNVYPNVCDNILHIDVNGSVSYETVKVYDLTGKEIKSVSVTDKSTTINTENLANGCYTYILTGKDASTKSGKFIVNH